MSYVRITSNADAVIRDLQQRAGQLSGIGVRGAVSNGVPYAIYCEFGTYAMLPHAMVRNSIPNIEHRLEAELKSIKDPSADSIKKAVDKTLVYAHKEISDRTHVDTGRLKAGWEIKKAELI